MIILRGQPAGSRVAMVLNYSHCVVLGSGPAWLGTALIFLSARTLFIYLHWLWCYIFLNEVILRHNLCLVEVEVFITVPRI